jgi:hypothetical protein
MGHYFAIGSEYNGLGAIFKIFSGPVFRWKFHIPILVLVFMTSSAAWRSRYLPAS